MRISRLALAALAAAPLQAQTPVVSLNHIVIVTDSATYRAISESSFIRDRFAGFTQETIHAGGGASWTGTYLFGRNTYLELFAPGGIAGPEGTGMVSFGVEEAGALWKLRPKLAQGTGKPADSMLRNRDKSGTDVPWFWGISTQGAMTSKLPTWVMEYHPDYQRLWTGKPAPPDISRRTFLAEFYRPALLLSDVVAVTLAADQAERDRLVAEARVFGYLVSKRADSVILQGPEITLTLVPATSVRRGVTELGLRLTRRGEKVDSVRLGRSVLRIGAEGVGTWRF